MRLVSLLPALLLLAGCASPVPVMIRTPPASPLSLAEVQRAPEDHTGRQVRWGGTILSVENRARSTVVILLARPLDADGEPRADADARGRFMAEIVGFVDPAELPVDRRLTVAGSITGVRVQDVGEYPYQYPVVAATARWLWPEEAPLPPYFGYPYYDPWFSPWYGWYGYGPWYGPGFWPYRPWYGPW
jgi:outer membrane lipoprotein